MRSITVRSWFQSKVAETSVLPKGRGPFPEDLGHECHSV
jgi:hypothetical protein